MFILEDPDRYVTVVKSDSGAHGQSIYITKRKATPEEYRYARARRLTDRLAALRIEMDNISAELVRLGDD